jgi:L-ascorbate metabolism protein UlaG (beta-lactamase superfamily)
MKGIKMQSKIFVSGSIFLILTQLSIATEIPEKIKIIPINHATFIISTEEKTIYVDPVGEPESYKALPSPDIILITDIHGDHLNLETVHALQKETTIIISPQAVFDKLQKGIVLNNGDKKNVMGVEVEAIPMYNLTEDRLKFHPKGRGNGYVLTLDNQRIYISGDSEDIEEMRSLEDIDFAFICMNLPYTMTEEQAASAVLEMKPKVVIPYHYRGKSGLSDMDKFSSLIGENERIKVRLLKWYD